MEAKLIFKILAFVFAFFMAFSLAAGGLESIQNLGRKKKRVAPEGKGGIVAHYLRNGFRFLEKPTCLLLHRPLVSDFFGRLCLVVEGRGYMTTERALCSLFCLALPFVCIIAWVAGGSLIVGFGAVVAFIGVMLFFINHTTEKRDEEIREAIPDALRSMSDCSHVGLSLPQTFQQVSSETEGSLKSLFLKAVHDLNAGKTTKEALGCFQNSSKISELTFIAVALEVQHRAGGSLKQVLDAARDSVESELELKRKLRVQTAQAKLSARIVTIMPFFLVMIFSFLSPGYLNPFFQSIEGMVLLGIAVCMQLSGILLVRRMLIIEVG